MSTEQDRADALDQLIAVIYKAVVATGCPVTDTVCLVVGQVAAAVTSELSFRGDVSVPDDYDNFLQGAVTQLHSDWCLCRGRDLSAAELRTLNTLLDNFFTDKLPGDTGDG